MGDNPAQSQQQPPPSQGGGGGGISGGRAEEKKSYQFRALMRKTLSHQVLSSFHPFFSPPLKMKNQLINSFFSFLSFFFSCCE